MAHQSVKQRTINYMQTKWIKYLSIQDARWQLALHTTVIGRIHPHQKLPASGKGNRQRVEDFSAVYTAQTHSTFTNTGY